MRPWSLTHVTSVCIQRSSSEIRNLQVLFCPFPRIPCAGICPLRASPRSVFRGMSRNDAARSASTNGSNVTGEEEIEFCTVDLTYKIAKQVRLAPEPSSAWGRLSACEMEDTNVFCGEAMLFSGWGIQNRHTLRIGYKLLICRELPVKMDAGRKCLLFWHARETLLRDRWR